MKHPALLKSLAAISLTLLSGILFAADWTVEELPYINGTPLLPEEGESPWIVMETTETEEGEVISAWLENQGDFAYLVYSKEPIAEAPEVFTFGDGYEVELINEVNLHFIFQQSEEAVFNRTNWQVTLNGSIATVSYPHNTMMDNNGTLKITSNDTLNIFHIETAGSVFIEGIKGEDTSIVISDFIEPSNEFQWTSHDEHISITSGLNVTLIASAIDVKKGINVDVSGNLLLSASSNVSFSPPASSSLANSSVTLSNNSVVFPSLSGELIIPESISFDAIESNLLIDASSIKLRCLSTVDTKSSEPENESTDLSPCQGSLELNQETQSSVDSEQAVQSTPSKKKKGGALSIEHILAAILALISLSKSNKLRGKRN